MSGPLPVSGSGYSKRMEFQHVLILSKLSLYIFNMT